jgi:hypothetical protein
VPGSIPAVFGLWENSLVPGENAIAFGLSNDAPVLQEYSIWRADLSPDQMEAEKQLSQMDLQMQRMTAVLETLPGEIKQVTNQASSPSFDLSTAANRPEEVELLGNILSLNSTSSGPAVSFGLGDVLSNDWKAAYQEFQVSFARIQQLVTQMAWVETRMGGQLVGWSVVNWTGDFYTSWKENTLPDQRALHQHSLQQAMATRVALLRVLAVTMQGAGMFAFLISNPGGVILALPAVWKYVNQVLDQIKQFQQVSQA